MADEHRDVAGVEHQLLGAPVARRGRQSEVIAAGMQVRAQERHDPVAVAQTQKRDGGEMGACAFAADQEAVGAEALGLGDQPERGGLAIVRSHRIGVPGPRR